MIERDEQKYMAAAFSVLGKAFFCFLFQLLSPVLEYTCFIKDPYFYQICWNKPTKIIFAFFHKVDHKMLFEMHCFFYSLKTFSVIFFKLFFQNDIQASKAANFLNIIDISKFSRYVQGQYVNICMWCEWQWRFSCVPC